jgi:hypothetical protein
MFFNRVDARGWDHQATKNADFLNSRSNRSMMVGRVNRRR